MPPLGHVAGMPVEELAMAAPGVLSVTALLVALARVRVLALWRARLRRGAG